SASTDAPRSTVTRRPAGSRSRSDASRAARLSSGTLMSTTPANLPASRADRLSSQVAPQAATFSEIAFTSPGLSSPTKVRTSGVVMAGLLGAEATAFTESRIHVIVHRVSWGRRVLLLREAGEGKSKAEEGKSKL